MNLMNRVAQAAQLSINAGNEYFVVGQIQTIRIVVAALFSCSLHPSVQERVLRRHVQTLAAGGACHDFLRPRLDRRELAQVQVCNASPADFGNQTSEAGVTLDAQDPFAALVRLCQNK